MQTLVLYASTGISEVVYVLFVYVIDILSAVISSVENPPALAVGCQL